MTAMRYRLALDLGTTSIGWCVLRINPKNEPVAIVKAGVRIFSDGRHPKTHASLAVARREARQARRRRDRVLKRKRNVMNALIDHGFSPKDRVKRQALAKLDPYELRKAGLDRQLTPNEFARAIFHLNQRRGFKSNRKTDANDNESSLMKGAISALRQELNEKKARTVGEWLADRHSRGDSVRARLRGTRVSDKAYDFYIDRQMVLDEFEALWSRQQTYNPNLFNDAAKAALFDAISFQRRLRKVPPGRCTLIPTEPRAPLALPSVQRFRVLQEVNNLRVLDGRLREQPPLSKAVRDAIVDHLETGKNAGFKSVVRRLAGTQAHERFNLQSEKRPSLKGNVTSKSLGDKKAFGSRWQALSLAEQDRVVELLLAEEDDVALIAVLRRDWDLTEEQATYVSNVRLPEGYGRLSRAALERILPQLEDEVITYDKAVKRAGFTDHSGAAQDQTLEDRLPYYGQRLQRHVAFGSGDPEDTDEVRFGRIANPTVHVALNQLRVVVNAIVARYGTPAEIFVEVTRDLKLSEKRKREIEQRQTSNQKRNDAYLAQACEVLNLDAGVLDAAKRRELIHKMILWHELDSENISNRRCPFSGKPISISALFSELVEIEHILPFSRTLDDSLSNKTISFRHANRVKGNATPYEAFGAKEVAGFDYAEMVQRASRMPTAKARRFAPDGYEWWLREHADFLARALNDTAYISRVSRQYLSAVCDANRIYAVSGHLTGLLRAKLGLNSVLTGSYSKNRDDHRHHAVDACVIGITDRRMLQRVARASARGADVARLVDRLNPPWDAFLESVNRAVSSIKVSHKPDHGYQRKFLEDTAFFPVSPGRARSRARDEATGRRETRIVSKSLIPISGRSNPERHGFDPQGEPRAYKGYVGGANYCIEIVRGDNGRWQGEVISSFEANQIIRLKGRRDGWLQLRDPRKSQSGRPLAMRLLMNDTIEVRTDEGDKCLWRLQKISSSGQLHFAAHNESNTSQRDRDKSVDFSLIRKQPGPLMALKPKKVTVSPIGVIRRWKSADDGDPDS